MSSTPGDWTVTDPVADQYTPADSDIAALHVRIDAACRLTMTLDLNGTLDPAANLAMYDMNVDGLPGIDRSVQVGLSRPGRPAYVWLGAGSGGGIGFQPTSSLTIVDTTGWSGTLDALAITKPGDVMVRAAVWEYPLDGGAGTTGTGDMVPNDPAGTRVPLAFVTDDQRPLNIASPTIAGPAERGGKLSCAAGNWTGAPPIGFVYQWLRDGVQIPTASTPTYVTVAEDVGHLVACEITATGPAGTAKAVSAGMAVADQTPPGLSGLALRPATFRAALRGRSIATRRLSRGTRVAYRLSEPATVKFSVQRRNARHHYVPLSGAFGHPGDSGTNAFRFSGRYGGRALKAGVYRLVAQPRDPFGNVGHATRIGFRVI